MGNAGGERVGVYPGTFDPITLGHSDIIRRGAKLVDRLVIGVTTNMSKSPIFSPEERIAMVEREVEALGIENASVVGFNALLMRFAEKQGASVIIRGLRAVADFEYEYQMAGMNQHLNSGIETIFLMADVGLPLNVIGAQLRRGIDLVVHISRTVEGGRKVTAIEEVEG